MSFNNFLEQDLLHLKNGFSDKKLAQLLKVNEDDVRNLDEIIDSSKIQMIDTCAAEFDSNTGYFYSTYEDIVSPVFQKRKKSSY